MTRRYKVWSVVTALFTAVNVGGAAFAAAQGELLHAVVHVALALVGALGGYLLYEIGTEPRVQR